MAERNSVNTIQAAEDGGGWPSTWVETWTLDWRRDKISKTSFKYRFDLFLSTGHTAAKAV
jgi:hypothetical protein